MRLRYQLAAGPRRDTQATVWHRIKLLTLDLSEDWQGLTLTDRYRDRHERRWCAPTNNVSEQRIGLNVKERYRPMRGYKSKTSLRVVLVLTAYVRENQGAEPLAGLLTA